MELKKLSDNLSYITHQKLDRAGKSGILSRTPPAVFRGYLEDVFVFVFNKLGRYSDVQAFLYVFWVREFLPRERGDVFLFLITRFVL
jgi:hypothetical protein